MAYSRSPPRSPSTQEDWLSRGPQSIKTYSTSSSRSMSHASRSQSLASASSRAYSSANFESTAYTYYTELKAYLKELLIQEAREGPHPHRVAARQKLTRLSNLQFHELAMDVYDEVVRRNKNDKLLPFLAVKEQFHPKRNQARQKLATLPVPRFQDLASDVYFELTRRYSSIGEAEEAYPPIPQIPQNSTYNNNSNNTQPQPSKSTNIVPVKGMISVENLDKFSDDESITADRPYGNKSTTTTARSPLSPVESPKDYFSSRSTTNNSNNNNSAEMEKMKSDYEHQISIMNNKIKQLQDDLEFGKDQNNQDLLKSGKDKETVERLKMKEEEDQKMIRQMEDQYKKLNDKYDTLNREYREQQEAVRTVKQETKQMLDELKRLAKVNEELLSEKEKTDAIILKLQGELKDWQIKYDKARIELRSIKASSITEFDHNKSIINENFLQPSRDGFISQDHIFTYQANIDDLLTVARSSNPSQVINVMKSIVTVCRCITEEVEAQEETLFTETRNSLYDLKTRFSASLSDLLIAGKYHASGMGISPVSLLDRAAGHLTSVIVELVKLLGMKASSESTSTRIERQPTTGSIKRPESNQSSYYGGVLSNKSSIHHKSSTSVSPHYDDYKPSTRLPSESSGHKYGKNSLYTSKQQHQQHFQQQLQKSNHNDELSPEDLVKYLKTETDNIVQTIQNLLAALRLPQQNGEVHAIISSIVKIVATISELSKATCQTSAGYPYRNECEPILSQLGKCSQRLSMIQNKFFSRGATATATAKRDLAKEAYEIAKFTKELINLFETDN